MNVHSVYLMIPVGFFTLLIGRFFGVEALTAPRVLTVLAR
jgi:hypothetical protein